MCRSHDLRTIRRSLPLTVARSLKLVLSGALGARILDVFVGALGRFLRVRARPGFFIPAPLRAAGSFDSGRFDVLVGALRGLLRVSRALLARGFLLRASLFLVPDSGRRVTQKRRKWPELCRRTIHA